ncbi:hypothetical protein DF3PB_4350003 [uncultured Defluviicoccus sp.]|uniref:Uncharacterized protein n=1 Tax=metagenome TaxID=256318 RepID=A0A380TG57_9ZZZZ|nr:hypothetical protein DF3PB_4350003 [uncultured Defluviicoccus sp.]
MAPAFVASDLSVAAELTEEHAQVVMHVTVIRRLFPYLAQEFTTKTRRIWNSNTWTSFAPIIAPPSREPTGRNP